MKIAVIGAGNWGRNLVRTFHQLGALSAVAEADPAVRAGLAESCPGVAVFSDLNHLLDNPEYGALVIATPAPTHFALAKQALLAGKDVFLEKPMTLSAAEAEEIVRLAGERERVLMVGHLLLYQPAIQWIKKYIDSGAVGNVRILTQERLKLGRVRTAEDVLWSFGVHDLAVLLYLVGSQPESVEACGQYVLQPHIADDVYLHLSFEGGIRAHLHVSWFWPEQRRRLTVAGSEAMLVYDEIEQTVTLHKKGVTSGLVNRDEGSEVVFQGGAEPLLLECRHFLQAVERRSRSMSDGASAVEVIGVLEKASEALLKASKWKVSLKNVQET
jgi:predicted dehydrogenase